MKPQQNPQHVAIIMDGNGRWAKEKGQERIFGHQYGVEALRDVIKGAVEIRLKYLTLYAFSNENWNRPQKEVDALMALLVSSIVNELPELKKNNIRIRTIGEISRLPEKTLKTLLGAMEETSTCTGLTVVVALSYGSRQEIAGAVKAIIQDVAEGKVSKNEVNESLISNYLDTNFMSDPDILIRTGGERRLSNFLLWQLSYTELFFTDVMWPDFRKQNLFDIIENFKIIERRFGKTGEQLIES